MGRDKLRNYELTASIHTTEIHAKRAPVLDGLGESLVKVHYTTDQSTGKLISHIIVNPHCDGEEVLTFSEYEEAMAALVKKMNLRRYEYDRLDIRLDSYEDNYLEYFKLNGLFIGLFTMVYRFRNDEPIISFGQQSRRNHSIYVKNQLMGIEYYDKKKQSDNKFPCKARLEFRALKLNGKRPEDVVKRWFKRCNKLENYFDQFTDKCNESLFRHYKAWLEKNQLSNGKSGLLMSFIRENQDIVYTTKQLEKFCRMCGVDTSESRAKNIGKKIELISRRDIREYITMIKESVTQYMDS